MLRVVLLFNLLRVQRKHPILRLFVHLLFDKIIYYCRGEDRDRSL